MTAYSDIDLTKAAARLAELDRLADQQEWALLKATAPEDMLSFAQVTMPHPMQLFRSRYAPGPHHERMADELHRLIDGGSKRLVLVLPPRHGKTELASKRFIPWWVGNRPTDSVIFATYGEEYARDIGAEVRSIMQSREYTEIFPKTKLSNISLAADDLQIEGSGGGKLIFAGRGGTITGRGGNLLIADDLFKDAEEAASPTIREKAWTWFTRTFLSRQMDDEACVVLIGTRWDEDDVIGRLTDPRNACYDADEAAKWTVVRLAAIADDDDPMGREPGEPLWPSRFGRAWLEAQKRLDKIGFSALYQGRPAPDDGAFFKAATIKTYKRADFPKNARMYAASDHAISLAQRADLTCLGIAGIDGDDNLYVHEDLFWKRADGETVVQEMVERMRRHHPLFWWAERGHISLSLGPALRKQMQAQGVSCAVEDVVPVKDKMSRAQAIQARMAVGKVFFPENASWWPDARYQLLAFPHGGKDDFVDMISLLGLKIGLTARAGRATQAKAQAKHGTLAELKANARQLTSDRRRAATSKAWGLR